MKLQIVLALATSLVLALTASAQVEQEHEMKIVVAGVAGDQPTAIHWVGDAASDIDMHAMQVGETQSIVDESGRSILITREEEGFKFEVDGKTVMVPEIGEPGQYATFVGAPDVTADFNVEIIADDSSMHDGNTVTIISNEPLDATTQESIKAVLQSAGRDDTVTFIDGGTSTAGRHVKLIRKTVEVE